MLTQIRCQGHVKEESKQTLKSEHKFNFKHRKELYYKSILRGMKRFYKQLLLQSNSEYSSMKSGRKSSKALSIASSHIKERFIELSSNAEIISDLT